MVPQAASIALGAALIAVVNYRILLLAMAARDRVLRRRTWPAGATQTAGQPVPQRIAAGR